MDAVGYVESNLLFVWVSIFRKSFFMSRTLLRHWGIGGARKVYVFEMYTFTDGLYGRDNNVSIFRGAGEKGGSSSFQGSL